MNEISRGRRRNAARVATRPRPVPLPTDDRPNETHKKNHAFPRARPASHRRRPPRVHRLSRRHSHHRARHLHHRDRRLGGEKRPIHPIARATRTHRSCCQTPTHEYVVPRSIPIAGPSALLMMTRDARVSRRVVKCRRVAAVGSRAFRVEEKLFEGWRGCVWVCDESSLVDGEGAGTARVCVSCYG